MFYQYGINDIFYKKNLKWTNKFVKENISNIEKNYNNFPSRNKWNCDCHVVHEDDTDVYPVNYLFLKKEYEKLSKTVCKKFKIKDYHLSDIWYNYYKQNQYQEPHTHAGQGGLTAVHYLIFNPNYHSVTHFTNEQIKSPKIKQGDILFFPANIEHFVPKNKTDEPRLTVAFTITKRRTYEFQKK